MNPSPKLPKSYLLVIPNVPEKRPVKQKNKSKLENTARTRDAAETLIR